MRWEMKNSGTDGIPRQRNSVRPRIFLERHASDNLAGAWARTAHSCHTAVDEVHVSVTTRQQLCLISNCWRQRIDVGKSANAWSLQEQPIEHILELRPDVEHDPTFPGEAEVAAQAESLRRLPLPAVVVVVRCGRSELTSRHIRPGVRIQHQILCWIDAVAVRIFREQRLP